MFEASKNSPKSWLTTLSGLNFVSNSLLKLFVKFAITRAQWGDRVVDLESCYPPGFIHQANLMPEFDKTIGDLATVLVDGPYQKVLVPSDNTIVEAHSLPPSELRLLSGETELDYLKRLFAALAE